MIDLHGQLAIPGFIESHGHFTGVGETKEELDLTNAKSWDDIVAMVGEAAKTREARRVDPRPRLAPGEMVGASRRPNVEGFPTHASLDKVSPNNPVVLTHASGHAAFVERQGDGAVGHRAQDQEPGRRRDPARTQNGEPTGLLRETAAGLIKRGAERRTAAEAEARDAPAPRARRSRKRCRRASRPSRTPARRSRPST